MSIEVGNTLRMIREAKDLKLKDVATAANISMPFLTLVEQGRRQPSLTVLRELALALSVPFEALILASQPQSGTMNTVDSSANRIVESLKNLKNMQDALRDELESFSGKPR